ncbi:MAG: 50S ribosomal protein L35 [Deltaproteobacteria bacterium CG07_land_8_20_14_0_80_38_7]|nr:MAG: 50S ribosomal protein L35 [Deltaproteobacteria bacterium CG07_land_8_20_14_0_80_38_7]
MPKLKTKKSAAKRLKVTKSGKIKRKRAKLRHILTNKTRKQKRGLRSSALVSSADMDRMKRLLPYG